MGRRLFCEISPLTYKISTKKSIFLRKRQDKKEKVNFALEKSAEKLPESIYKHNSLIRRKLGNVRLDLQDNKAVNLNISTPKVSGVIIKPGEIFSFWSLVGECSVRKGYKEGLMVGREEESRSGIGGGMCQFTNLIHWMVLHTPLEIVEHHHHDGVDMFPDFGRKVPFGTGTSIVYNYFDYRFKNVTDQTFQLITYTDDEYLYGELRSDKPLAHKYHVKVENEFFSRENNIVYRNSEIYARVIDKKTGNELEHKLIKKNHAKVLYDTANLKIVDL
jgi:vancomycin resistance protein VanW